MQNYEAQPMPFFDTLELKYLKSHPNTLVYWDGVTAAIDNRVAAQELTRNHQVHPGQLPGGRQRYD